jgi:sugar O-acyltransferase (sialic acid O-acetyltransferase NeuD family)
MMENLYNENIKLIKANIMKDKKICIFGAGGSARETYWIAKRCSYQVAALLDLHKGEYYDHTPIFDETYFDPEQHVAVVAVGSPILRASIVKKINDKYGDVFISLIDPSVIILSPNVKIGKGAVIAPQCVITCDLNIGDFCQLNVATSIMHDTNIGHFFTSATGVKINGRVKIGNYVSFGSNAATRDKINITDKVIIGASACVINDIVESGTYIGAPAKRIK